MTVPTVEGSGGSFGGGDGLAGNPYVIEDVWDLQNMSNNLSAHYVLGNDIDASSTASWNSGAGFAPVGTGYRDPFTGGLDGGNHTITGLYINRSSDHVGLFGCIFSPGWVRNVALVDCNVTGRGDVGALAGENRGNVSNSSAEAKVHGSRSSVGGLVGDNEGILSDSSVEVNVSGSDRVGGLAGGSSRGTVSHCHATGDVIATGQTAGGLVGDFMGTMSNCTASVNVSGDERVGGLVGHNWNGAVYDSFATGSVNGANWVGGLVGYNNAVVHGSHASGSVTGSDDCIGGLVGRSLSCNVSESYATGSVTGDMEVGGLMGYGLNVTIYGCRATGDVSGRASIGGLVGQISVRSSTVSLSSATGNVTGSNYVGGLVGSSYGTLIDSVTAGTVTGTGLFCGGLVGKIWNTTVSRCHSASNVIGNVYVGGIVGYIEEGEVLDSHTSGDITGDSDVGGVVGRNPDDRVSRCYSVANVTGETSVGGVAGFSGGTLRDSYAWGTVTRSSGTSTHFGGFIGFNNIGKVINCYSTGRVVYDGATDPTDKGFAGVRNIGPTYQMSGNFWDVQTSQQSSTAGEAIGRTTAAMKTRATFVGANWDLDSVWMIVEHVTYPLLRWQDAKPPTANAGPDQTVDEDTVVTFDGTGSVDDFGIVEYRWTLSDDGPVTLRSALSTYVFNTPGVYVVTLNVTDLTGNWDNDTTTVTVMDITPPVADAGLDRDVDEDTLMTFNGTGSSDNVGVINYTWSFTDGHPVVLHGPKPTYTFEDPGTYVVTLNVTDATGRWSTANITITVLDRTPPEILLQRPVNDELTRNTTCNVSGMTEPDTRVDIRVESSQGNRDYMMTSSEDGVFETSIELFEGVQNVVVTATDAAGNEKVVVLTIVRDSVPPVLTVKAPGGGRFVTNNPTVHFVGNVTGASRVVLLHKAVELPAELVSGSWESGDWEYDLELGPTDLEQNVIVKAYDLAGNEMEVSILVILDTVPPSLYVDASVQYTSRSIFTVSGTTDETIGSVKVNAVVGPVNDGVFGINVDLVEGANTLIVIVEDEAGNRATETLVVTLDTVKPTFDLDYPASTKKKRATISGTCDDDVVRVWVNLDSYEVENGTFEIEVELEKEGKNPFVISFEDRVGNTATETITIKKTKSEGTPGFGAMLAVITVGITLVLVDIRRKRQ